ncbi:MAG: glycosyl hydrolase family 28-related protein [Acutalibacteraceae bacterium]|jgi:hypothetical protein
MINIKNFGAIGDSITDDTLSIQTAFDQRGEIYIPEGDYRITKTLLVRSDTTIDAHEKARLFMCGDTPKKRNDFLISNSDTENGNCNIKITGGIWDGNNQGKYNIKADLFDMNGYSGTVMNFVNVNGLYLYDFTVANSAAYYVRMCRLNNFEIVNINFFSEKLSSNQDGLHFGGDVHNGVIQNIKAVSYGQTNDDMIALNADDCVERVENLDLICGDISDIKINSVFAENCYTFLRMLSVNSAIYNIEINNIKGGCRTFAINLDAARYCRTPLFKDKNQKVGNVHDVSINNMDVSWNSNSPEKAMILIETVVDNFKLSEIKRRDSDSNKPTLEIAHVGKIVVKDITTEDEKVLELSGKEKHSEFGDSLNLEICKVT